ncbi:hypothetical protein RHSIM_Rhsim02G0175600 [Rhododendron simsii]|uniref:Lon N-terminal domain-containing protein n=1 Tax=Rhododendron simsii TaxID=118357 RepID=A0A834LWV0_RHOSS|nr:hypothetical protein RHSIM_Rhsim02G0175600 [Rhododendron simsii]
MENHLMTIRELDAEELQVEEVEDDSSVDDRSNCGGYGEASTSGDFTNISGLASLHTYLGEVEDTRHRLACLDGGAVLNIPLFYLEGVVLFPESILPLRVLQPNLVAAVERALSQVNAPYTIGIIRVYKVAGDRKMRVANIGTTAEIRQYRRLDDGSLNVVTRGQQRFRLNRQWINAEGAQCGEVQVIQEDLPLRTPRDAVGRLAPLRNLRAPPSHTSQAKHIAHGDEDDDSDALSEESFKRELSLTEKILHQSAVVPRYGCDMIDVPTASDDEKLVCQSGFQLEKSNLVGSICSFYLEGDKRSENDCLERGKKLISGRQSRRGVGCKKDSVSRLREVPRAFWPNWVYHMHDSYYKWKQIMGLPRMDVHVTKPDCLSFYIASRIPVSESTRQELLDIDGTSYRLRRVIELLKNFDHVRCKSCQVFIYLPTLQQAVIGKRSDVLIMSSEGKVFRIDKIATRPLLTTSGSPDCTSISGLQPTAVYSPPMLDGVEPVGIVEGTEKLENPWMP